MVYLLYTEETGLRRDPKSRFFVYGAMFFPIDALDHMHNLVQRATSSGSAPVLAPST